MSAAPASDTGITERTFLCTFGAYTQTTWTDRRSVSWQDLIGVLTAHKVGRKEGTCVVPAVFRGDRRHKANADQIDTVFLDSDGGATLEEIAAAVRSKGWAAVISSTHSHLTIKTKASLANWRKFLADCPINASTAYLVEVKGMLPRVAVGAVVESETEEFVIFRHAPCGKFRVVLPLGRPWRAADYPSQDVANAVWKERIEALAAALGLQHDQACTDTSRLFYLPRRPSDGPPPQTAIIQGDACEILALPAPGGLPINLRTSAPAGRGTAQSDDGFEHVDQVTGEVVNLRDWVRKHGDRFLVATALRARRPSVLTGRIADHIKIHTQCPNEGAHTEPGTDGATFVTDAGLGNNRGFVIHCRHAHCDGKDRLFFVKRILELGWLTIADLTDSEFMAGPADGATVHPKPTGAWPPPLDFLTDADAAPPELLPEHVPDALWDFVKDTSERMGVDPTSVALACLVSCASVMSDTWCIQPKRYDTTWTENPRLWGAIVGDPSILKTPVIATCTRPIDHLDAEARERHQEEMRDYKTAMAAWKRDDGNADTPEPTQPKLERYLVEGATIEAISEVLRDDDDARQKAPAGKVLARHDEMSEFFGNLDRYKTGGRGGGDRGAYLRLYNGGRYVIDRIGRGSFAVPNWSACFLGGIQPGPIQRIAKDTADDGLLQRLLYCVPGSQQAGLDRAPDVAARQRYEALFPKLTALHPRRLIGGAGSNSVVLHAAAHRHRDDTDALARAMAALPDTSPRLRAALGKWPGLFARLCLTFHLIDLADAVLTDAARPHMDVVPEGTALRVARFMRDIVAPHLLRAEAVMFSTVQTGHAQWIAGHILAHRMDRITSRDIVRAYRDLRPPEARAELDAVMAGLTTIGWLEPELPPNSVKPVSAWIVNPAVHIAFEPRAQRERARRDSARADLAAHAEMLHRARKGPA
jgi:hypothetical protein